MNALGVVRAMTTTLRSRADQFPVVTILGPRQSGKTTLCRQVFAHLPYANLERPDTREFARTDPRGFLAQFANGGVLDEIQRAPELLSYIQVDVDERKQNGRYILTGSHQLELARGISQSLAGRTALLRLLPLSIAELRGAGLYPSPDALLFSGLYPRIHSEGLEPSVVLGDYFQTYVQRDLRELMEIRHLDQFERFVRLLAGRVGQPLNLSALGAEAGVSGPTAKDWLALLEASFLVVRLAPWFSNLGKRLVKTPKIYFCDPGLAAWLLNVRSVEHLESHPLRGNLFENLMVIEAMKHFYNQGTSPPLYFYRDAHGTEVDLVVERGNSLHLAEIKSSMTVISDLTKNLLQVQKVLGDRVTRSALVYGGTETQRRSAFDVVPWYNLDTWMSSAGPARSAQRS
jgi:uncharacterized protein